MGVIDFLGEDYRSALGLPVINIPGCAPVGDNFTETVAAIVIFLQSLGPLPEFDELGRPGFLMKRFTAAAPGPASMKRVPLPTSTAAKSAWSRSAVGGRWCNAILINAAPSTIWAAV